MYGPVTCVDEHKWDPSINNPLFNEMVDLLKCHHEMLSKIWALADMDCYSSSDSDEFALAMHVIQSKIGGYEAPNHLTPPCKKKIALYTSMPFISFTPRPLQGEVNREDHNLQVTRNPLVLFAEIKNDLSKNLLEIGGIGALIFFFAKIVEVTSNDETQARALNILLQVCKTHYEFMLSFAYEFNGFRLINSVLETPNCNVSCKVYQPYLNCCLSSLDTKQAIIINSIAFSHLISSWRAWHRKPETINCFTNMLLDLISPVNSRREFNILQMRRGHIVDIILTMLKDTLVQMDDSNLELPYEVARILPELTKALITTLTLELSILNDVFDTLLLLHRASNTYICHSKSSFYYLLPTNLKSSQIRRSLGDRRPGMVNKLNSDWESSNFDGNSTSDQPKFDQETIYYMVMADFINMIAKIIEEASESMLYKMIGPIVRPGVLVILGHSESDKVREAVLNCLICCLKRGKGLEAINTFITHHGLHLIANQLHQHSATFNLINQAFAFIMNTQPDERFSFEENFPSLEIYKMSNDHWNSFVLLFALLPNSVNDVNLCHTALIALRKFIENLPLSSPIMKHLYEIGFIECLIKVLVNADNYQLGRDDSIDGYEDDVIINDVLKVIYSIGRNLFESSRSQHWNLFLQTINQLSQLEKKTTQGLRNWFRESLVHLFEAAHDAVGNHLTDLIRNWDDRSKLMKAINKSEKFFNLFSPSDETYMASHNSGLVVDSTSMSTYSSFRERPNYMNESEASNAIKGHVSNSELTDRFKKLIFKSVDFLILRDDLSISEKEKFFARSLLHRIFQVLDLNKKRSESKRRKSILNNFIGTSKEAIKNELCRLIHFLMSPLQPTPERLYYVSFLKSNAENLTLLLRSNNRFANLFESFLKDLLQACADSDGTELVRDLLKINPIGNNPNKRMVTNEISKRLISEWFVEWNKEKFQSANNQQEDASFERLQSLSHKVVENAMCITRDAVEAQNQERKVFINHLKHLSSERYSIHKDWKSLIEMFTHEKAVWYNEDSYLHSWELDPTEGPMRVRRRLRRCHLDIPSKFFAEPVSRHRTKYLDKNLAYLFQRNLHESDFTALIDRLYTNERILYTTSCTIIAPGVEYPGEILIGSSCIHFVGEQKTPYSESTVFTEVWLFDDIKEIHPCRYQLQNNAFEMFLTNGSSYLISFENKCDCDEFLKYLYMKTLANLTELKSLSSITQLWREGLMTNFEYLTYLNKISGRSFNDLMQYPVFPFILADYDSTVLNLKSPASFRNLSRPMAVQHKSNEEYYINQYNYLKEEYEKSSYFEDSLFPTTGPYHFGSHYSNSGTVLHFLVRLPPFTQMFLTYQDNSFDIPDRTFHSMETAWRLASGESKTDFKELIPEFFTLPEFLLNQEKFNFGIRQNGEVVDDVKLPTWCRGDARLFILIHRQALESDYITQNLHDWIDLVFGYKQTGRAAVEAINCFHPATYYGVDVSKIEDPVKSKALHTMIRTFGQMPKQLFNTPHPSINTERRLRDSKSPSIVSVMEEVTGIKWGNYIGSPAQVEPLIVHREKSTRKIASFCPLITNIVFSLEAYTCLLLTYNRPKPSSSSNNPSGATYITSLALVSWNYPDNVIRIKYSRNGPSTPLISGNLNYDKVTVCATTPGKNMLMIGHQSGLITVYNFTSPIKNNVELTGCKSWLHGHRGPVNCIVINQEFNVIVSGGVDGACIIWDLNKLFYIRTIASHSNEVLSIAISQTLGDIASLSHQQGVSLLKVNTINGSVVGEIKTTEKITSMCYSSAPEGVSVNVLAVGFADGTIKMYNSWDLALVRQLVAPKFNMPIKCMTYTHDNQHFHIAGENGTILVWGKSITKKNNFVNVFFHSDSSSS
ncbi:lysosomal-trafficking regulator isoform X2 [Tetranychus urticae]|uniref:lysosomal-trafficking regulator isoform X2 n=1 Tax=Tetranychus urticae TaxID=32264 RepID=UPI000D6421FC|nr:lysosomal-trafficking regulator isoform X2 [Tetranychus urticae]